MTTTGQPARSMTLHKWRYELSSGAMTSVELVRRTLADIAGSEPVLHAFTRVLASSALVEAADADLRRGAGETGPLLGIPVAVSDEIDVEGVPTLFGTSARVAPAAADAEVVRRLRAAGAVIIGKTAAGELGQQLCTTGPGPVYTQNPWRAGHTPGASCGGAAAAVSSGLVAAAIGADSGGGLRIAAAWTNLVGIKPQRGRISTWPRPEVFHGLTCYGVLASTVADAAVVLDAVSGNVGGDRDQPLASRISDGWMLLPGR